MTQSAPRDAAFSTKRGTLMGNIKELRLTRVFIALLLMNNDEAFNDLI
jgi:hypothetical protein